MSLSACKALLLGSSVFLLLGCQPTPIVVDPDGDNDPTVIEHRDIEIERKDSMPPPHSDSGTDVKVDVGGEGINVDVDRKDDSNP